MQAVPRWRSCGSLRRCRWWRSCSRRTCCGSAYSRPVRRILARAPLLLAASAAAAAARSVRRTSLQGANGRRLSPGGGRERPREQLRAVRGEADGRPRRHACVRACVRACLGGVCVRAGRVCTQPPRPALRFAANGDQAVQPAHQGRQYSPPLPPSLPLSLSLSFANTSTATSAPSSRTPTVSRPPPAPPPPYPIMNRRGGGGVWNRVQYGVRGTLTEHSLAPWRGAREGV